MSRSKGTSVTLYSGSPEPGQLGYLQVVYTNENNAAVIDICSARVTTNKWMDICVRLYQIYMQNTVEDADPAHASELHASFPQIRIGYGRCCIFFIAWQTIAELLWRDSTLPIFWITKKVEWRCAMIAMSETYTKVTGSSCWELFASPPRGHSSQSLTRSTSATTEENNECLCRCMTILAQLSQQLALYHGQEQHSFRQCRPIFHVLCSDVWTRVQHAIPLGFIVDIARDMKSSCSTRDANFYTFVATLRAELFQEI